MNVLRASRAANVKRVVISSRSLSTFGFPWQNKTYSEKDWIEPAEIRSTHDKAKLEVEKAAWKYWEEERHANPTGCFELVSVLPVWVLGPILSASSTASVVNFSRVFYEMVDKVDNTPCALCDVRDVALAHIKASQLEGERVVGQRFLIATNQELVSTFHWTEVLRAAGYKVATVVKKPMSLDECRFDNHKMRNVLGIEPIELKKTLIDMAESLIRFEIIKVDGETNGNI